jgi:hypothetical protein
LQTQLSKRDWSDRKMMSEHSGMIVVMAIIVLAAIVGIWNNCPLYDENLCAFRVNIFRFYFALFTNPRGALTGEAYREYKVKTKYY